MPIVRLRAANSPSPGYTFPSILTPDLLNKSELKKIRERLKDQGVTIVPLDIHFGERGFAKIQIALVKGKKLFDKRDAIKSRDMDRQLKRGEVE